MNTGDYEYDESTNLWSARKDGFEFCASNPVSLLGLAALFEHVRPKEDVDYWWAINERDVMDELLEASLESSFMEFRKRNPDAWLKTVEDAIGEGGELEPHNQLGISKRLLDEIRMEIE